jgi:integrase
MPKPATGELRRHASGFEARIRVDDEGTREGFDLATCKTEDEAAERCKALASIAVRVRRARHAAELPKLLDMAARARAGRAWESVLAAVDVLCAGTVAADRPEVPTFVAFATDWTDGKLHKKWPDHVPKKDSDDDARVVRKYVEPIIGELRVDDFTLDHAELVMASLPEHLSPSSRRHVAQLVRRVLGLAVYPGRMRRENPIPRGWLPKVKGTKAFTHLYPDEDRTLLGCADVPLIRRLFFGVLTREGLRRGELAALRWRDLDLAKGHIALDRNKTNDPRSWALDAGVARALSAWHDRYHDGATPDDLVFAEDGVALYVLHMADKLQADLKAAKVTRETLFERSDVRRPLRTHDLRSTFVTVSLANGKTETWVADRTGHRSSEMINRYRRAARTWAELDLGPLAPLDECIPELSPTPQERPNGEPTRGDSGAVGSGNADGSTPPHAARSASRASKSGVVKATKGSNPLLSAITRPCGAREGGSFASLPSPSSRTCAGMGLPSRERSRERSGSPGSPRGVGSGGLAATNSGIASASGLRRPSPSSDTLRAARL